MNTQDFRKRWYIMPVATLILTMAISCKEKKIEETVVDNVIFRVDTVKLYSSNSEKTKQKTGVQYVSILYADLFGKGISNQELAELSELNTSLGDKTMANELLISHYLSDGAVKLMTDEEMRADVGKFVEDTYLRFFLRTPTPYELYYLADLIKSDPGITPSIVYTSFALSNEYYFY